MKKALFILVAIIMVFVTMASITACNKSKPAYAEVVTSDGKTNILYTSNSLGKAQAMPSFTSDGHIIRISSEETVTNIHFHCDDCGADVEERFTGVFVKVYSCNCTDQKQYLVVTGKLEG